VTSRDSRRQHGLKHKPACTPTLKQTHIRTHKGSTSVQRNCTLSRQEREKRTGTEAVPHMRVQAVWAPCSDLAILPVRLPTTQKLVPGAMYCTCALLTPQLLQGNTTLHLLRNHASTPHLPAQPEKLPLTQPHTMAVCCQTPHPQHVSFSLWPGSYANLDKRWWQGRAPHPIKSPSQPQLHLK